MPDDIVCATPAETAAAAAAPPAASAGAGLPRGYRLREFLIERVLGAGGFGIVYSAIDLRLERRVAIKEYMPAAFALRDSDYSIQAHTAARDAYQIGLRSFVNEAKLLARFEHPALIKVLQFWQEKGTAYMVMPLYTAPTVKHWLKERKAPPPQAWLASFLSAAADALDCLHREQCLHRDIAPDNILVLNGAAPLLLDFGAARRVLSNLPQAMTVMLKPGYAPIEQYSNAAELEQGAWTDVYALCAVAHFMLTGRAPAPAVRRLLVNDATPLRAAFAGGAYSAKFLAAIEAGLNVRPELRPQSMTELRALLEAAGRAPAPATVARPAVLPAAAVKPLNAAAAARPVPAGPHSGLRAGAAGIAAAAAKAAVAGSRRRIVVSAERMTAAAPPRQRWGMIAAALGGSALAVAAALAWWSAERIEIAPAEPPVMPITQTVAQTALETTNDATAVSGPAPAVAERSVADAEPLPMTRPEPAHAPRDELPSAQAEPSPAPQPVRGAPKPAPASKTAPPPAAAVRPQPAPLPPSALIEELPRAPEIHVPPVVPSSAEPPRLVIEEAPPPASPPVAVAAAPAAAEPLRAIEKPQPVYPAEAARDGITRGRVVAQLQVGEQGRVEHVEILEAQPPRVFDREVRRALAQWRYAPPGAPRQVAVELVFRLER
jgi:hypothetical protein